MSKKSFENAILATIDNINESLPKLFRDLYGNCIKHEKEYCEICMGLSSDEAEKLRNEKRKLQNEQKKT